MTGHTAAREEQDDSGSLEAVVELLAERAGLALEPECVRRAVRSLDPRATESQRLEAACESAGLRVRWLVGPAIDAVALARPDLPVVGRSDAGTWWVLDDRVGSVLVHAVPVGDPRGAAWMRGGRLAERVGQRPRAWAMVEPLLPASPLASPGGTSTPLRRLLRLLGVERSDLSVVVLYGVVAGLLSLATPFAIQVLINWLAFGALVQPVVILGVAVLVCLTLAAGLTLLQRIAVETVQRRLFVRVVADLSARLARVRPEAFDQVSGPELANRFFDVLTLQKAAGTLLLDGVTAVLQVLVAVALLAVYHPWLLVFDVVLLAGMALALMPFLRRGEYTAIKESKAKYAVAGWIEEVARQPVALRQDGARLAEQRADRLARSWLSVRDDHFRVFLMQLASTQALQVVASVVLLVASGMLVLRGELTIGQLVAAEFIVNAALVGFSKFSAKLDTVYDLLAGVDKLGSLLDLPHEEPGGLPGVATGPATVQLEGARLVYGFGASTPRLDLELSAGSRTVIRGEPGAGKSALADLVAGNRTPAEGAVRRDGGDLRQLDPWARHRGVMLVRPTDLVVGSVRDNVALDRAGVGDLAVWSALERVGLRARVEGLGGALDARLGTSGTPLSESEVRALLVARAIVNSPRLVVADSLLDGLPAASRDRLIGVLGDAGAPWTLLLLTCDPACVMAGARRLVLGPEGLHGG